VLPNPHPLLPLPQFLLLSITFYAAGYPFGQLRSAVPAVSPPSFLLSPSLLAVGTEWEEERALIL